MDTPSKLKFIFDLLFVLSFGSYIALHILQFPAFIYEQSAVVACDFFISYFLMASYVLKSRLVKTRSRLLWPALFMYFVALLSLVVYSIYVSSSAVTLCRMLWRSARFSTSTVRIAYIHWSKRELLNALTNTLFTALSIATVGSEAVRIYSLWGKKKTHDV